MREAEKSVMYINAKCNVSVRLQNPVIPPKNNNKNRRNLLVFVSVCVGEDKIGCRNSAKEVSASLQIAFQERKS